MFQPDGDLNESITTVSPRKEGQEGTLKCIPTLDIINDCAVIHPRHRGYFLLKAELAVFDSAASFNHVNRYAIKSCVNPYTTVRYFIVERRGLAPCGHQPHRTSPTSKGRQVRGFVFKSTLSLFCGS